MGAPLFELPPEWLHPPLDGSSCVTPTSPRLRRCRSALLGSVDKLPALNGLVSSGGRLNVAKAIAALRGSPAPWLPTPYCESCSWQGYVGLC